MTRHPAENFPDLAYTDSREKTFMPWGVENLERPFPNLRLYYIDISRGDGWVYVQWVDANLARPIQEQLGD